MQQATTSASQTAHDMIGGTAAVRRVVDRFYDLMESDPAYRDLRALHAPDLAPMRASLTGFLVAWLGGPREWFEQNPGKCMMSAHRDVAIGQASARQWADAMDRAVRDSVPDAHFAGKLSDALGSMALRMGGVAAD